MFEVFLFLGWWRIRVKWIFDDLLGPEIVVNNFDEVVHETGVVNDLEVAMIDGSVHSFKLELSPEKLDFDILFEKRNS